MSKSESSNHLAGDMMHPSTINTTTTTDTVDTVVNKVSRGPGPAPAAVYSWANINKLHAFILLVLPLIGLQGVLRHGASFAWQSYAFALPMYWFSALGITMGYHRLWSHRAYKAIAPLRVALALAGASSVQGSIRWWCTGHRYHHRYTDTERDPYNSRQGLFFSHFGWMLFEQQRPKSSATRVCIADLEGDWIVRWQHKHYLAIAFACSLGMPSAIAAYFWNDFWGGFYVAGIVRLFFLHHSTFCINSLAHWLGSQHYDDKLSPRDSFIVALLTFGEGYHNFHHQFPNDFRNGFRYYHFDPTKWMISLLSRFGCVYDLKTFPHNEIEKGRVAMLQKKIDARKRKLVYGALPKDLPEMTWIELKQRCHLGEMLVVVFGIVHDVTEFMNDHPGGRALLKGGVGRDVTQDFTGQVYDHSRAAENLLSLMRVARIKVDTVPLDVVDAA